MMVKTMAAQVATSVCAEGRPTRHESITKERTISARDRDQHQIFPKEYVAEAQGGGEVSLNAASFEGKAVVSRGHQKSG